MINKKSLHTYLSLFGIHQRIEGELLFQEDAVIETTHDLNNKMLRAKVEGENIYNVQLKYLSTTQIASGSCTCRNRSFCKHQAAFIYFILEEGALDSNAAYTLKGKAGSHRTFPTTDSKELEAFLKNSYSPFLFWRLEKYDFQLVAPTTILCHLPAVRQSANHKNFDPQEDEAVAVIHLKDKQVSIKCNKCDAHISYLCVHTRSALDTLIKKKHFCQLVDQQLSYDGIVDTFALAQNSTPSFINKYFHIFFTETTFELIQKDKRMISREGFDDLLLAADSMEFERSVNDSYFLDQKKLEFEQNLGNALVWSIPFGQAINLFPTFIEGKLNRDRTKIQSHLEKVEKLYHVTTQQKLLFSNLDQVISINNQFALQALIPVIHAFLNNNSALLFSFLHYYLETYDNPYAYYEPNKIRRKDLIQFSFSEEKASLRFEIEEHQDYYSLKFFIRISGTSRPYADVDFLHQYFIVLGDKAFLYNSSEVYFYLKQHQNNDEVFINKSNGSELLDMLHKLSYKFEIGPLPDNLRVKSISLTDGTRKLLIKESGSVLTFEPLLSYEQHGDINILSTFLFIEDPIDEEIRYAPDDREVSEFILFMESGHPQFQNNNAGYEFYYLSIEEAIKNNWFLDFFENCKIHDIEVFGEDLLQNFKFNKNKATISSSVVSGIDWFELNVHMSFGNEKVSTPKWIEAIVNKEKYIRLSDGSLGILPEEWLSKLEKIAYLSEIKNGQLVISKLRFNVVEELFSELDENKLVEEIKAKKEKFNSFDSIKKHKIPQTIKAELRDYQLKGFLWLKFLDEFNFGGCLADDMGLGKTLQVIIFLADQKKLKKAASLAVVPRSLLFNWVNEINKFCPSLKYHIHHGASRHLDQKLFDKTDLFISTYDTITNDIEIIRQFKFNYSILDESQAIKNPNSKRYKAMRLIQSNNRLVMTGTPIENNTFDLYAQFSFINPGLFISQSSFKNNFSTPIDVHQNNEVAELLRKIVYPFLLRRTKEQVAQELPEKTESVLLCEMGERQQKLYDDLKNTIRTDLNKLIETEGISKSRFKILEGLLRLRQMCNSPFLLKSLLTVGNAPSAKLDVLMDQLSEVILSHKALVFSQFVSMLQLIKTELDKRHIPYAYLDGSTQDRQAEVNRFQDDNQCRVFLVSLKAGNTGLNLTSAEYVYIVDPWWNPAVEAQAIDRSHRIGQKNHVFAYRLICKGTIEEKILQLQAKKKKIAKDIIRTDENILKSLSKEKLLELLD